MPRNVSRASPRYLRTVRCVSVTGKSTRWWVVCDDVRRRKFLCISFQIPPPATRPHAVHHRSRSFRYKVANDNSANNTKLPTDHWTDSSFITFISATWQLPNVTIHSLLRSMKINLNLENRFLILFRDLPWFALITNFLPLSLLSTG